ncbi:hypothetical protein CNMCM7691_009567 [Aspergillus felis]|uniref:Uncharacterized protein n=1 Tax=Aspergillus felis TaxID=1287682 RepID=A0A8H6QW35_9EURO|nr:hypothetical protein CNMCM7691_009567 [Aspergillus felis]
MASAYAVYFAIEAPNCAGRESTRPLAGNVLAFSNLRDRRVLLFWLLELASAVSFVFWLIVATSLSEYPITVNFRPLGHINAVRASNSSADSILASMPEYGNSAFPAKPLSKQLFVDVWFSLGLTVAVDALAVVATFNRALIKRFHYAVSQRMMFLAAAVSYAFFSWSNDNTTFSITASG